MVKLTVKIEYVMTYTEDDIAYQGISPANWNAMDGAAQRSYVLMNALSWIEEGEATPAVITIAKEF